MYTIFIYKFFLNNLHFPHLSILFYVTCMQLKIYVSCNLYQIINMTSIKIDIRIKLSYLMQTLKCKF